MSARKTNTSKSLNPGTSVSGAKTRGSSASVISVTTSKTSTRSSTHLVDPSQRLSPTLSSTACACSTCSSRCCYEYTVTVTGYDIWGIVSGMKLAPHQFLVYYPTNAGSAGAFKLDQSGHTFDIALDKTSDDRPYKPCIFLAELPGGGGRCGGRPLPLVKASAIPGECQANRWGMDRQPSDRQLSDQQ